VSGASDRSLDVGLVLAAGGGGSRMGWGDRKQFAMLGGVPVLARALRPFLALPRLARAVVVLPGADLARGEALARAAAPGLDLAVVAGGATRQESVRLGLAELGPLPVVLVHDAARPLASADLAARVAREAAEGEGVVPTLPVADTLKRVVDGSLATVERAGLLGAQTPQGFPGALLSRAHARAHDEGVEATDDAALLEAFGHRVRAVRGEPANLKITTAADWELAQALVAAREAPARLSGPPPRTGIGYDVHRLERGRACVLGGVRIDSDRGPVGHSDGDVLIHAVMDALLGAAGEPDIGHRFPAGDPRWAGADSLALLAQVRDAVAGCFEILFVDCCLVAEAPRIAPHVPAMRSRIAAALAISPERVNVKATTAEGLGAIGRGEGLAAQAVATLREREPEAP
jgi:2-C-methyl-D-erythritol 4-phosphate cytidylyltransferase/2-C-methyl-D-erythritol 2,4-cyclodiphosphate synthase